MINKPLLQIERLPVNEQCLGYFFFKWLFWIKNDEWIIIKEDKNTGKQAQQRWINEWGGEG